MRQNYKRLGDYIRLVDVRNKNLDVQTLLGVSIQKKLMPSIANTVGTDMSNYKIIQRNQFAYGTVTSRNGDKISIALLKEFEKAIVSQIYLVFEIKDTAELLPDYLMMWFRRPEFDRYARFKSHGSARETFDWNEMIETKLPIPSIEKQKELIAEYQTIENRIRLNNELCQKLEETAQTVYRHWFEDFEFPVIARSEAQQNDEAISKNQILQVAEPTAEYQERSRTYKSSGGEMVYSEELGREIPKGWKVGKLGDIAKIVMGQSPEGESYNQDGDGEIFYQGRTEFGFRFPSVKNFTTSPKRRATKGDILMSVRAPVGDLNIASTDCCIGRGIASLSSKNLNNIFLFYTLKRIEKQFDISNDEGTIFGSITKDDLHEIKVIVPYLNIEKDFNNYMTEIDKKIEILSKQNQKLEELKSLLLGKMAVEG